MNLLCPNCQKMLSVPEQLAGQPMKCPLCTGTFSVPALPQSVSSTASSSEVARQSAASVSGGAPGPVASSESAKESSDPEEPYSLAAESPRSTVASSAAVQEIGGSRPAGAKRTAKRTSSAPGVDKFEHEMTLTIRRDMMPWLTRGAAVVLFVLLFFPWIGAYPGGHGVYTQTALQTIWGGSSTDAVGEKVIKKQTDLQTALHGNWLMFFYFLLVVAILVLAFAPLFYHRLTAPLPDVVQRIWPWRSVLVPVLALVALFLLMFQLYLGFGLQSALTKLAADAAGNSAEAPKTPEELVMADIRQGLELGRFNTRTTIWLTLAVACHALLIIGGGLENLFERRQDRSTPRIDVMW